MTKSSLFSGEFELIGEKVSIFKPPAGLFGLIRKAGDFKFLWHSFLFANLQIAACISETHQMPSQRERFLHAIQKLRVELFLAL